MEDQINFFTEEVDFNTEQINNTKAWVNQVIENEGFELEEINFIFCSDEYLHKINVEYLDHDTYTDVITFDNSDTAGFIESDIFISIERIIENAKTHEQSFDHEVKRVIIHGVLHLLGYKDKSEQEASLMRTKENEAIALFEKSFA
ncbi:rRNA maturation RNase YbeY [Persicobacter psychrovividus]|uniref:Endoribonuclease YbeY n=1 Tax=Persicobacter psychrovividus TaxID=387638 RepID=A0ABN6L3T1_9BACT|nr:endoribonuclease YbeY [Persicobacter psychrovividus]